jgi:hypothetical protein
VEGHLIDTHSIAEVRKKADEWLTDCAGSDNMNDSFHGSLALGFESLIDLERPLKGRRKAQPQGSTTSPASRRN